MPAPNNLTPPVISGSGVVGNRLAATNGTWDNNPTTFAYQWKRCTGEGTGCSDIGGATSNSHVLVQADDGMWMEIEVDATNTGSSVTPPAFTPDRTVTVTTPTEFEDAVDDLQAGDLVNCSGTFPGQVEIRNKVLADFAVFDLTGALFPGSSGAFVGLYFVGSRNIRTIGGEFTNPGGDGIRVEPSTNIEIYTPLVHNVGVQGILVSGNGGPNNNISIFAPECYACGNIAKDPHSQKGTGLHCIYFGGALQPSTGQIVEANLHDQPYGCGIQIGANARDLTVLNPVISDMTGAPYGGAGGNAFNIWGEGNWNVLVQGATGDNITGNVCLTDSLFGPNGSVVVQDANFTDVGRSPAYMPNGSRITYIDCVST